MARRKLNIFSLSFLDVMSCGFGAVVLIFLIISRDSEVEVQVVNRDLLSEIRMLDYQVLTGEKDLFELKVLLDALLMRVADSDEKLNSTTSAIEVNKKDFDKLDSQSVARVKDLNELKSDVETREKELARLKAISEADEGGRVRRVEGEGDRQYLTGMRVGGKNVLIALDVSGSMLDESIVNILRRRNMSEARQKQAPKWRRAVETVEWISAQLPLDADFQIFAFNTETRTLIEGSDNQWVALAEGRELDQAINSLQEIIPSGGTSIENLFIALRELNPLPDNVYLIIDSLPTQGTKEPRSATVSGKERLDLFRDAIKKLPVQVPVNVIMFPMEGDPMAAASYWNLARVSGGSYLAPSKDWP
ncbi:MAG: VWA domain-containing protein [Proteobacteria bacterium]|nr:VWA domain-containing protein [Pseudomonadota bacterium]